VSRFFTPQAIPESRVRILIPVPHIQLTNKQTIPHVLAAPTAQQVVSALKETSSTPPGLVPALSPLASAPQKSTQDTQSTTLSPQFSTPFPPYSSGGGFSNIYPIPDYHAKDVATYFYKHSPPHSYYSALSPDSSEVSDITAIVGNSSGIYNRIGRGILDVSANGDIDAVSPLHSYYECGRCANEWSRSTPEGTRIPLVALLLVHRFFFGRYHKAERSKTGCRQEANWILESVAVC
jgi:hypothetical protein